MDLSTSYTIKAQVQGQNQIGGLEKGLDRLKTSSNNAAGAMNKLKGAASQAFGALKALAPAIGIAGMGKLVNDTLTLGDELGKLNEQTGITVPTLDRLRQAADLAGVDFKKVSKSFGIFAENMMDFTRGKGMAFDALEQLNIDPTFINTRGVEQLKEIDDLLFEVAEALYNLPSGSTLEQIDLAKTIFGGQGMKMIPLLNQGRDAIMGLDTAFTDDFADRIEEFNDSMAQMGEKFNFLKFSLTEALLPALELFVDGITKAAEFLKGLPKPLQAIVLGFTLLTPAIVALAPVLAALIFSFKTIAAIKLGAVIAGIIPAVTALAAPFAPFLVGGAIVVGIIALGKLIGTLAGHVFASRDKIGEGINAIKDFFSAFKEGVVLMFQAIGNAIKKPFVTYADFVKGVFTNAVNGIKSAFQAIPNAVKSAVSAATAPLRSFLRFINRILAKLAALRRRRRSSGGNSGGGSGSGQPMALGGIVTSPTLSYLGEAGSEYVIPARKAAQFSKNYLAGYRGSAAVPRFAEGGYVAPNVNITTGAVTQMDGTNFITTKDLASAVQSGINQTINLIQGDFRTRRALGL
tara:strand:- start:6668 stop:8395 length:1728 start_codon:yes stop_codon:yes gene_type:complete